jgi:transcriptional regulator with XRE-family HTH domain
MLPLEYMILPEIHMKKTIYSLEHKVLIEKLKKARSEAKLDQKSVAELLDRTQSYISKIEAGQRRVDLVQLKTFAKIYKKPLNYFLSP